MYYIPSIEYLPLYFLIAYQHFKCTVAHDLRSSSNRKILPICRLHLYYLLTITDLYIFTDHLSVCDHLQFVYIYIDLV